MSTSQSGGELISGALVPVSKFTLGLRVLVCRLEVDRFQASDLIFRSVQIILTITTASVTDSARHRIVRLDSFQRALEPQNSSKTIQHSIRTLLWQGVS